MDAAIYVLHGMVNNLVSVVAFESFIREQGVSVEGRASFDVLSHFRLQFFLFAAPDYGSANLAAAFKDAHDCGFVLAAGPGDPALALADVHVPRFATDESFVRFDFAARVCRSEPCRAHTESGDP